MDWILDEELQQAIANAGIAADLATTTTTTTVVPGLPILAPAPPMIPPADWSGYGVFDSNPPPTASGGSSEGGSSTPATTAVHHTRAGAKRHDPDVLLKRQRNKVAAQRYRQKKLDRISELEVEVSGVKRERDELRIKLAKQEAETAALRELLKLANPGMLKES